MTEYAEMLSQLNEIVNLLKDHTCQHENCCIKSLLREIEFKE